METINSLATLMKAIEAGNYNVAPSQLVQGSANQIEHLDEVMQLVAFEDKALKLTRMVGSKPCKSTLAQFNRKLSYGVFGGSAQLEGQVGAEKTSRMARITVPMCFYSHTRRVSLASTMVDTADGKASDESAAQDAALIIAADVEFDLFKGRADYSNSGVFDGNTGAMPSVLPNMIGLDVHIRQSDNMRNSQDLNFNEYGGGRTVVLSAGGPLTQDMVEDAAVRSVMNHGQAEKLIVDPIVLSNYNKIAFGKERIILAGGAQESTGADLRKQWVSGGTVSVEASRFLSGKTAARETVSDASGAPANLTGAVSSAGDETPFLAGEVYTYFVTAINERGESSASVETAETIAADGDRVTLTITKPTSGTFRAYHVYRSDANGDVDEGGYIGSVVDSGGATTTFVDLGNKLPAFVTGYLVQGDTMEMAELCPYSRQRLAQTDLSMPEAHFTFTTLKVMQPRKNVIIDSLR